MLPALNSARERGRAASCVNNLKQLGSAHIQYSSDFDGWAASAKTYTPWFWLIDGFAEQRYSSPVFLGIKGYLPVFKASTTGMWSCPSAAVAENDEQVYGMRIGGDGASNYPHYRIGSDHIVSAPSAHENTTNSADFKIGPSQFLFMGDTFQRNSTTMAWTLYLYQNNTFSGMTGIHNKRANALFGDGHVEAIDKNQFCALKYANGTDNLKAVDFQER